MGVEWTGLPPHERLTPVAIAVGVCYGEVGRHSCESGGNLAHDGERHSAPLGLNERRVQQGSEER